MNISEKYNRARYKRKTKRIQVNKYFPEFHEKGAEPEFWTVQNLTADELSQCREEKAANESDWVELLKKIQLRLGNEKIISLVEALSKAISEASGTSGKVSGHIVYGFNMIKFGLVDPVLSWGKILGMQADKPQLFNDLFNEIFLLSQMGGDLLQGELNASGTIPESKPT